MKMHTTIATIALGILLSGICPGASILEKRATLEGAKLEAEAASKAAPSDTELAAIATDKAESLAAFDAGNAARFGPDWLDRWMASEYPNPNDEAVDIYINDGPFRGVPVVSAMKRQELLAHIASKPVIVEEDMIAVRAMTDFHPGLLARLDELAVHLGSGGIRGEEYFAFKHISLLNKPRAGVGPDRAFVRHMTTPEWFELASANAHFSVHTFAAMRDHLLAHTARLLIDKRRSAGEPTEGPDFEAAFAPVSAAINAPKFEGLAEAVAQLGIDFSIPTPDFRDQEAIAATIRSAAENRTDFTTPWGAKVAYQHGLGSVMFVMGEAAYTAWRDNLTTNR